VRNCYRINKSKEKRMFLTKVNFYNSFNFTSGVFKGLLNKQNKNSLDNFKILLIHLALLYFICLFGGGVGLGFGLRPLRLLGRCSIPLDL
jgi:hypothetical protein